jgi:glucose-1-phosphate thymidylyltransferase
MKVVVPTAGKGTRLYPHTHTKPKPIVRIAGKPILGHILDRLPRDRVEEVVLVVGGPMQEQVVRYVEDAYGAAFEVSFVEQAEPEGLGHSVLQARPLVDGDPLLIALGDMLFERGYGRFLDAHDRLADGSGPRSVDGSIGVKRVDDPRRYGVVETGPDGRVDRLVEKPDDPPSDLAISGVYVFERSTPLFESLAYLVENDVRGAGDEYQLTDALQGTIDRGVDLGTFEVDDWYDCGRPETLLEANRVTLDRLDPDDGVGGRDAVVVPPVDIGEDVAVEKSVLGPYVSVDDGATIADSIVRDSIVGRNASVEGANLRRSIVGDAATVDGDPDRLNLGDNSVVDL